MVEGVSRIQSRHGDTVRSAVPVVVLGAGPAGLTAAYELLKHDCPVVVLERDGRYVGGIARTVEHNGYRFDIGGHRFFSKNPEIEKLWTEILGRDMLTCTRLSRIRYRRRYFDYPLKATNVLLNLGPVETVRCMASYVWARMWPVPEPRSFEDWVRNQFGYRLYTIFFKTYTEKVWGISTRELSADWAAQRIKGLDLGQVIKSAFLPRRKPKERGAVIKTLIDAFRYPTLGPGQLWERIANLLSERGSPVRMSHSVVRVKHSDGAVTAVVATDAAGAEVELPGSAFICSIPIRDLVSHLDPEPPAAVRQAATNLSYRDFLTVALMIRKRDVFPDNWIYIHEPGVRVGRIQNFKNWSPAMVPDEETTCLGLEYFCFRDDDLWKGSDTDLIALATTELERLGICSAQDVFDGAVVRQEKAYPVYNESYLENVSVIRRYVTEHLPNLHLVGRNGMHKYNNQDHSMLTALLVVRNLALGTEYNPWKVNGDAEYHEEMREGDPDWNGRTMPGKVSSKVRPENVGAI